MYDLFSDFFDSFDVFPVYREETRCPNCGRTYSDFQKTGKFGCSECYKAFEEPIARTLRQVQASSEHMGKIPSTASEGIQKKRKLKELKDKLTTAVKEENYELAAKLHKEIKEMEG
ncbi:MAG: UvrB/UvrC motif-containing protein [Clostridia bacterium]|nr:UvrB/UvrC motif-containing protein [Clostridia bacterium]